MPDGSPYRGQAKSEARADRELRQREELEQIREGLRRIAGDLAARLIGKPGRRAGDDLRFGDSGKMRVTVAGHMIGRWHDYGSGNHGDMLKLIREHQGLSFVAALDYARSYLGMPQPDYARPMSHDERTSIAERLQAREQERAEIEAAEQRRIEAGYVRVARAAQRLWDTHADRPAPADHPYVASKGIDPEGLRVTRNGTLLVPVRDAAGALQTLQRIWPDGSKRGLFGGRMRGGRLTLGEIAPDQPVLFCEGVATGKSLHRSTGLPVVVCFSAGNLREVMREWRGQNPDQVMVTAGDNDHHKERLTPPKANVGALTAERMRVEIGAVAALPPFTERDPGTDWNDFEQSSGSAAVRRQIDGSITAARTAKQEQSMDGDTTLAPAPVAEGAAAPADPRRVLIEATALEGIVTLGMNPRAAVTAARGFVQGLNDNQVKLTLDAGPTRGWIMRADGSLDPEATAAAIKAKGAPDAATKAGRAARKPEASAAASPASTAPADPLRGAVAQMAAQAGKLQQQAPELAKTLASLDASLSSPDALRHDGLRTRIAWAIMDYERSTGTGLALPEDLRREMEERMVSYPGLRNPRAQAVLRETAAMSSVDLIRQVRRVVCNIAKARDQDTPEIADQLQTLDTQIRVMSGAVAPEKPAVAPVAASPATPAAKAAPAAEGGSTVAASPGPGVQAEVRTDAEGKQDGGAKAGAAKPPAQEAAAGQTGGTARKSLANHLLSRVKPAPSDGHPPWERITSGLAERLERMEEGIADRRTARVIADAESAGRAAMTAVEGFVSGPGRNLLERVQTAAAREPGGLDSVIKEMRQGGKHAGLRTEFDEALRTPGFARSYDQAIKALGSYGEARQAQMQEFGRRGIDPTKAAAFERIDASLGEDAARIPGREGGKSALQELATKAAEVFMAAVDKVRAMVNGAVSATRATASPSPSPSP